MTANEPTRLHKAIGVTGFMFFIGMNIASMLPGLSLSYHANVLLACITLACLGLGTLLERVMAMYSGSDIEPREKK